MDEQIVFSAIRPTGKLHLGHLAGVLTNYLNLQNVNKYKCIYCIADYHALISKYTDSSSLKEDIYNMLLDWLSIGLDPDKSILLLQSMNPYHSDLMLLLSSIVPLPWLYRNPIYKEQLNNDSTNLNTYLFLGYPVLMASDILLYNADLVPVGEDQFAHLDIVNDIVKRFNNFFGKNILKEPKPLFTKSSKILGTDGRKMSKSYNNAIYLDDNKDTIWSKISTMKTDINRIRKTDKGNPDNCPVWNLHLAFNNDEDSKSELCESCKNGSIGCLQCKRKIADIIIELLQPIQDRRNKFIKNNTVNDRLSTIRLDLILQKGYNKIINECTDRIRLLKDKIGLLQSQSWSE